ncbi:MAG: hypothetical protein WCG08_07585 [Paludibacter sp.]|jgi:hypothetical protein
MNILKRFLFFVLLTYFPTFLNAKVFSLQSGASVLTFSEFQPNRFGLQVENTTPESAYIQTTPIEIEIVSQHGVNWYKFPYSQPISGNNNSIICKTVISTPSGSKIQFQDIYTAIDKSGTFQLSRNVQVLEVGAAEIGFSTRISLYQNKTSAMSDYDFFVPGVWYKSNEFVNPRSLAANMTDNEFWFRVDRLPLPIFMLQNKKDGFTFSVSNIHPDGSTFKEELGLDRIIDSRMKFASIGMRNNQQPTIGITYPGTEGERSYIKRKSLDKRWCYRSHPLQTTTEHQYKMAFRLSNEDSYVNALKNTWDIYYNLFSPKLYNCDLDKVYSSQLDVLSIYWKTIHGASGVPFRILLDGRIDSEKDYNYNIGFVGQQPGNASLLIREGLKANNADYLTKGEQMADFWATNCVSASGCPKTWYDPYPQTWRGPEVAIREIGDGMIGLLRAWNYEQQYKRNKPNWLNTCKNVADWCVKIQLKEGGFYNKYDYNTGINSTNFTNCTTHIIPYLVEMYMATANKSYKEAAIKAGDYMLNDIMINFKYVGGAIDNPNVMDKESASMALRAYWALYDLDNDKKWMDAVLQTIYFYRTWVVCWDIPIPKDDPKVIFPLNRSVSGQSLIATGQSGADTYAAIDALNFYRAYLYTGDEQLLHFSKLLLFNTRQFVNWDIKNDPIKGFANGFVGEAMSISSPRGHGVGFYLPWSTYNQLEPLVFLEDIFGSKDINVIQKMPESQRQEMIKNFSENRTYPNSSKRSK